MKRKMPIAGDVRIHRDPPAENQVKKEPTTAEVVESVSMPSLVTVMGFDKHDVLFRSDEVGCVQWRDSNGKIVALLARIKPHIWGFSKHCDADWNEVIAQYGNPDV